MHARLRLFADTEPFKLFGVAKGIQYLHEMDICHGDIKGVSEWSCVTATFILIIFKVNILIDNDRQPRITDLGIASIVTSQSETLQLVNTTSRGFQGSLRWAPPEAILPKRFPQGHSSTTRDVYAFGCTMLEVCQYWYITLFECHLSSLDLDRTSTILG